VLRKAVLSARKVWLREGAKPHKSKMLTVKSLFRGTLGVFRCGRGFWESDKRKKKIFPFGKGLGYRQLIRGEEG